MRILAIDPGNEKSAYVVYDNKQICRRGYISNENLLNNIQNSITHGNFEHLVIEMIASYGMPVGKEVFETCVWIGRFIQAWHKPFTKVYRQDVKMHLCRSMRAKDSNIRQAIIDKYSASGGGKTPQIGTKAKPGPLYGISGDVWAALAVAITFAETNGLKNKSY